jgi:hypothetical protein
MRRSITIAASVAALASFAAYGSALAQGVEVYVGPPAPYYYSPGPYVQYGYAPPAYGYYGYAEPGVVVYPRGRLRCGRYERWNGNHCVDLRTLGSSQP